MADILTIDDGRKEFAINGDENRIIRVHLTDSNLFDRVNKAKINIKKIVDEFTANYDKDNIKALKEADEKIRKQIDYIYDYDVSQAVFGNISAVAPVGKDKIPYVFAFLEAIIPEMEKAFDEYGKSQERAKKHMDKYLSKYQNK